MVEDMANTYEKSQKLAGLTDVTVQKDTWHLLRDGSKVKRDLERSAYYHTTEWRRGGPITHFGETVRLRETLTSSSRRK